MTDEADDQLRARLRDVPSPDPAARERALAAAMAVFDEQQASRRRTTRWLMPVAAVLVGVVALGGALTVLDRDADDDRVALDEAGDQTADVLRAEVIEAAQTDDGSDADATQAAAEAVPADARAPSAAGPSAALPVLRRDADIIAAVGADDAVREASVTACDRTIVTEARDERDPAAPRTVLLSIQDTADGAFVLVLVPEGEPDACTELDRLPLP